MEALNTYLNVVQLYVVITCIMLFVRWHRLNNNLYVKLVVLLSLSTEVISLLCVYCNLSINYIYNVYLIFNPTLWLLLLFQTTARKKNGRYIVSWFLLFSIYNITLGEGIHAFNFETFIVGSFIYIIMFLLESFERLKREDFAFFFIKKIHFAHCAGNVFFRAQFYVWLQELHTG